MARIPARKRDDGRFEAEGVTFDPPFSAEWGGVGHAATDAIFGKIFARAIAAATTPDEKRYWQMLRGLAPDSLHLKTCDGCGALYLDGRSNRHRARNAKFRCRGCFARQRYAYVQRARAWRRKARPFVRIAERR
jgi:RNase P subunit RPR2